MQVRSGSPPERLEQIFERMFRQLKPRTPPPPVQVEFRRFANADSFIRLEDGRISVRMSDLLEGAPATVLESLAHILLAKLFRRAPERAHADRYRRYLNRREVRRSMHLVRQMRGRKFVSGPQGKCFNLEEIFEELNLRHFHGLMARPQLGWSRGVARSTLGHYDPSHNAIILSRLLDRPETPRLAVDYVLFHEMLHLRHPAEHAGGKRRVHTRELHLAEKEFPGLKEAREMLRKL